MVLSPASARLCSVRAPLSFGTCQQPDSTCLLPPCSFDHLNDAAHYHPFKAYAQSKLANLLFARQLAERLQGKPVAVVACHPGTISTDITQNLPLPAAVISMAARVFR